MKEMQEIDEFKLPKRVLIVDDEVRHTDKWEVTNLEEFFFEKDRRLIERFFILYGVGRPDNVIRAIGDVKPELVVVDLHWKTGKNNNEGIPWGGVNIAREVLLKYPDMPLMFWTAEGKREQTMSIAISWGERLSVEVFVRNPESDTCGPEFVQKALITLKNWNARWHQEVMELVHKTLEVRSMVEETKDRDTGSGIINGLLKGIDATARSAFLSVINKYSMGIYGEKSSGEKLLSRYIKALKPLYELAGLYETYQLLWEAQKRRPEKIQVLQAFYNEKKEKTAYERFSRLKNEIMGLNLKEGEA